MVYSCICSYGYSCIGKVVTREGAEGGMEERRLNKRTELQSKMLIKRVGSQLLMASL